MYDKIIVPVQHVWHCDKIQQTVNPSTAFYYLFIYYARDTNKWKYAKV